jgi:hypothetical protein
VDVVRIRSFAGSTRDGRYPATNHAPSRAILASRPERTARMQPLHSGLNVCLQKRFPVVRRRAAATVAWIGVSDTRPTRSDRVTFLLDSCGGASRGMKEFAYLATSLLSTPRGTRVLIRWDATESGSETALATLEKSIDNVKK